MQVGGTVRGAGRTGNPRGKAITRWIIDAILLKITDAMTDHLTVDGPGWALGGALVMSIVGTLGEWLVRSFM